MMSFLFTSESVSEGHPDKLCDQISDAILDEALKQDQDSRVAVETFTTTGLVVVGGELTTEADLGIQAIVRKVLSKVGYNDSKCGIDADHCSVLVSLNEQSADIAQGVNKGEGLYEEMGAGDQGIMFGYACNQTPEYMPLAIVLSHKIMKYLADLRRTDPTFSYLRPDSKAQVTVEYDDDRQAKRIDSVVVSTQHQDGVEYSKIKEDMIEKVIKNIIPAELLDKYTQYYINPTGRFVVGGPNGDTGLTGRKIVVDTYGGWVPHGGGCFSGKDATKVDRSATYMARYIAKNIVAAGLAEELEIQLAYAIGVKDPVSIRVNSFGTEKVSESQILQVINDVFDLSVSGIIETLNLRQPVFLETAAYGHFGRDDVEFSWEKCDKVAEIKQMIEVNAVV